MRKIHCINDGWVFVRSDVGARAAALADGENVNIPHTWNNIDGADGGGDYVRAAYWYVRKFARPELAPDELCYIEFKGVNSSAQVFLNGKELIAHDGGYSTFRADATALLEDENVLCVRVDNTVNGRVYPQTADFTFYGGIYRDVNIITVNRSHFDLDYYGSRGVKVDATVNGSDGKLKVTCFIKGEGEPRVTLLDADNAPVAAGKGGDEITVPDVHLWHGVTDPYLYSLKIELLSGGTVLDDLTLPVGFRTYDVDPKTGFILNGKPYPLRGVCRHQDRKGMGNAITRAEHEQDAALIREIGANTVRLAHYQHDDYFYDLCDKYGFVVWAEIPYISQHMPGGDDNALSQMRELIVQQYHHASICVWGISNEITMFPKYKKQMLALNRKLNDLCHELDPARKTVLACFALAGFGNKSAHITDIVSWNLYLGWYIPGKWINDVWISLFKLFYPKRALGMSEYGAEAMPNLHSAHPKRGDNTEEYQLDYHEYMLELFERTPCLWATHVWNMFDFGADARDQGGEPGMNHKGLVTYDRKIKKDAFYLYKAYWSPEPFVHICGKRFVNRTGKTAKIKVVSNAGDVSLNVNGTPVNGKKTAKHSYVFKVKLDPQTKVTATAGDQTDECVFCKVDKPDPDYRLHVKSKTYSWQKK